MRNLTTIGVSHELKARLKEYADANNCTLADVIEHLLDFYEHLPTEIRREWERKIFGGEQQQSENNEGAREVIKTPTQINTAEAASAAFFAVGAVIDALYGLTDIYPDLKGDWISKVNSAYMTWYTLGRKVGLIDREDEGETEIEEDTYAEATVQSESAGTTQ